MKHDITVVASHKTKKGDKFSFSTMPITVSDRPFVMSVTVGDDPFEMSILLRFSEVAARMSVTSVMLKPSLSCLSCR